MSPQVTRIDKDIHSIEELLDNLYLNIKQSPDCFKSKMTNNSVWVELNGDTNNPQLVIYNFPDKALFLKVRPWLKDNNVFDDVGGLNPASILTLVERARLEHKDKTTKEQKETNRYWIGIIVYIIVGILGGVAGSLVTNYSISKSISDRLDKLDTQAANVSGRLDKLESQVKHMAIPPTSAPTVAPTSNPAKP